MRNCASPKFLNYLVFVEKVVVHSQRGNGIGCESVCSKFHPLKVGDDEVEGNGKHFGKVLPCPTQSNFPLLLKPECSLGPSS